MIWVSYSIVHLPGARGGRKMGAMDMACSLSENDDTACRLGAVPLRVTLSTNRATAISLLTGLGLGPGLGLGLASPCLLVERLGPGPVVKARTAFVPALVPAPVPAPEPSPEPGRLRNGMMVGQGKGRVRVGY